MNEIGGLINVTTGVGIPNADDRFTLLTTTSSISGSLLNNINTRALDSNVVHKTGTETISGDKTFNNNVIVGTRLAMTPTTFGYSSGYKALTLGSFGTNWETNAVTISLGCDTTSVTGGSFTGMGGEIVLRRDMAFIQPNVTNTDWEKATVNVGEVNVSRSSVIGTDPGGSELLRVGGSSYINGVTSIAPLAGTSYSLLVANNSYNSGHSSGEALIKFGWANHSGAGIGSFKLAANVSGLIGYGEYGYNNSVPLFDWVNTNVNAYSGKLTTGSIVLGTDPGGSELLRVGGSARATNFNSTGNVGFDHSISNIDSAVAFRCFNANSESYLTISTMGSNSYSIPSWANANVIESVGSSPTSGNLILSNYYGDTLFQVNNRTIDALKIKRDGSVIVGTDPGGSELRRVGGSVKCTSLIANNGTGNGPSVTSNEVLIGTDPGGSEKLKVGGGARFNGATYVLNDFYVTGTLMLASRSLAYSDSSYTYLYGGSTGYKFNNSDGNTTWATLSSSAFVLGTDPGGSAKFRVGGTVRISDNITLTGAKYVYLRGDATTDGSVRISSPTSGTAKLEAYTTENGWQNISFS